MTDSFNRFHATQLKESVDVKTAATLDYLNRYSEAFSRAVSVRMTPMCICCSTQTVRTIVA
jgi:hypothetical protein